MQLQSGDQRKHCELKFVRYEPSRWEDTWREHVSEWSSDELELCRRMVNDIDKVRLWETGAEHSQKGCGLLDPALSHSPHVFSRFVYEDTCTGQTVETYIEPLAGLTRHPRALCMDRFPRRSKNINRGYIVLGQSADACGPCHARARSALRNVPSAAPRRLLVFDLGASLYSSGPGGNSQKWFVESYARHGLPVSEYYAWEAAPLDSAKVWAQIPEWLKPTYHWHNVPADPAPESENNPWDVLRAVAAPEDYVVVKLDIDNTEVEERFMAEMRGDARLRALVDEMFFEHHVNVPIMWRYWGTQGERVYLNDTYAMVQELRSEGIRFHSWP
ncbi:hypothetical protein JKP88DRAFT_168563 [Tribonema minus]|uniref:Uncharacterized protein n=1 Tax=Tribonema minus TaxID=303371 RepID=A0A836CAP5_9STRA|nr:hypothetical protein JKP88DRAFT_168563 [Tribonema minus]